MIKINLLPKTINEKAAVRNMALVFAVALIATIVAGVIYTGGLKTQVTDMESQAMAAEQWQEKVKQIQAEADSVKSSIQPIKQKTDFITAVLKYNQEFPALYEQIAKWTYSKVMLTGLQCDGAQVTISARAKTLDDLGRYLLNMYRATDLFSSVVMSSPLSGYPKTSNQNGSDAGGMGGLGYDTGGPQANLAGIEAISSSIQKKPGEDWISFTVSCGLKKPISPPTFAGAGAAPGGQPGAGTTPMAAPMPSPSAAPPGPNGATP